MARKYLSIMICGLSTAALLAGCSSGTDFRLAAGSGGPGLSAAGLGATSTGAEPGGSGSGGSGGGVDGAGGGSGGGGSGGGASGGGAGSGQTGSGGSGAGAGGTGAGSGGSGGGGSGGGSARGAGGSGTGSFSSNGPVGSLEGAAGGALYTTGNVILGAAGAAPASGGLVNRVGSTLTGAGTTLANSGSGALVSSIPLVGPTANTAGKVTVLDSTVVTGKDASLLGVSLASPNQAQGSLGSAGLASSGNLATVQVAGAPLQTLTGGAGALTTAQGGTSVKVSGSGAPIASVTVPAVTPALQGGLTAAAGNTITGAIGTLVPTVTGAGNVVNSTTGTMPSGTSLGAVTPITGTVRVGAGAPSPVGGVNGGLVGGVGLGR